MFDDGHSALLDAHEITIEQVLNLSTLLVRSRKRDDHKVNVPCISDAADRGKMQPAGGNVLPRLCSTSRILSRLCPSGLAAVLLCSSVYEGQRRV